MTSFGWPRPCIWQSPLTLTNLMQFWEIALPFWPLIRSRHDHFNSIGLGQPFVSVFG
jgi:hypothetical protein